MKKSANWLDDICKLLQDNDLALSYTPKVQTVLQTRLFLVNIQDRSLQLHFSPRLIFDYLVT